MINKMNILHNQHKHLLVANRVAFMIIGVLEAAWAPLVPYVKRAFAIDEGTLGLLMLCSGFGSICALPLSGFLVIILAQRRWFMYRDC